MPPGQLQACSHRPGPWSIASWRCGPLAVSTARPPRVRRRCDDWAGGDAGGCGGGRHGPLERAGRQVAAYTHCAPPPRPPLLAPCTDTPLVTLLSFLLQHQLLDCRRECNQKDVSAHARNARTHALQDPQHYRFFFTWTLNLRAQSRTRAVLSRRRRSAVRRRRP